MVRDKVGVGILVPLIISSLHALLDSSMVERVSDWFFPSLAPTFTKKALKVSDGILNFSLLGRASRLEILSK
jgi:hypothetical protein